MLDIAPESWGSAARCVDAACYLTCQPALVPVAELSAFWETSAHLCHLLGTGKASHPGAPVLSYLPALVLRGKPRYLCCVIAKFSGSRHLEILVLPCSLFPEVRRSAGPVAASMRALEPEGRALGVEG